MFTESQLLKLSKILWCKPSDIKIIRDNSGMTNTSIIVSANKDKYLVRLNGKGSVNLIDRENERQVYNFLHNILYDDLTIYVDDELKVSKFIEDSCVARPFVRSDIIKSMIALQTFHDCHYTPTNVRTFNFAKEIERYRKIAGIQNKTSRVEYETLYENCIKINEWVESLPRKKQLCQIDCNPDNMLFEKHVALPRIIDWEYAAIYDPHVDIAMWALYSNYSVEQFNLLMFYYFCKQPDDEIKYKIYAYAALGGMLWYNWCVYKQRFGITYGDYITNQFVYCKKYSERVLKYMEDSKCHTT